MAWVALLAVGWISLVALAPYLPVPMAAAVYVLGSRICHQLAERSLHLSDVQLPVCARCAGVYAGTAMAMLVAVCVNWRRSRWRAGDERPGTIPVIGLLIVCAAVALNGATVLLEQAGLWHPSNAARASAGAVLGAAAVLVVAGAVGKLHYSGCTSTRSFKPAPPATRI